MRRGNMRSGIVYVNGRCTICWIWCNDSDQPTCKGKGEIAVMRMKKNGLEMIWNECIR